MSLFTEYEKIRALKKTLSKGSKWEVVESSEDFYGRNSAGDMVYINNVNSTDVYYSYSSCYTFIHSRDIETFKRTFRPVVI